MIQELKKEDVYRKTIIKPVFGEMDDLPSFNEPLIKQEKAREAIDFGLSIDKPGYNIYVSGEHSTRRRTYLKTAINEYVKNKPIPNDICFVHNFKKDGENTPLVLEFKAGDGVKFKESVLTFAEEVNDELTNFFESGSYKKELRKIDIKYDEESLKLIQKYSDKIKEYGFNLAVTEDGVLPYNCDKNGKRLSVRKVYKLMAQDEIKYRELTNQVSYLLAEMSDEDSVIDKARNEELNSLDEEKSLEIIEDKLKYIKTNFVEKAINSNMKDKLEKYLEGIKDYILDNLELFIDDSQQGALPSIGFINGNKKDLREYFELLDVNIVVDNQSLKTAPVIFSNNIEGELDLIGGILQDNTQKAYPIDEPVYKKIVAGDLLKANGGYLIVDVEDVIANKLWDTFEKVLFNKSIALTKKGPMGTPSLDGLKTEGVIIDVKVILLGSLDIYYALYSFSDVFKSLFGVHARFANTIDRNEETELMYAGFIKEFCKKENLMEFSYDAVCRVIEYASTLTGMQDKLIVKYLEIYKLLIDSDKISTNKKRDRVEKEDVDNAIANRIERVNFSVKNRDEMIRYNETVLSVADDKIGEVNALAVTNCVEFSIGNVLKLTANTYRNKKYAIASSDKEAQLSGSSHDKALNIVLGYLGELFSKDTEFPYTANITFEQCYGGVDGDSATLAKTCAILSNLAETPVKQRYGITGSMNQKGDVQPIGGVNEKIEGFFDLCMLKGLNTGGGVIIPKSNIRDLMLPKKILNAIDNGNFTIYAIDRVEDAIELLTGLEFNDICEKIKQTY